MVYDDQDGAITPIELPAQAGCLQCHWQADTPRAHSTQASTAQAGAKSTILPPHERMAQVHEYIAQQPELHHPDLMVSDNTADVKAALALGTPAIFVSPEGKGHPPKTEAGSQNPMADLTRPLLLALDFDCTLAGAEGDWLFTQLVGHLPIPDRKVHYTRFEQVRKDNLLGAGPALTFTQAMVGMKKLLALLPTPMDHRLNFAVVTARGKGTKLRVHHNLRTYIPDYQNVLGLQDVEEDSPVVEHIQPKQPGIYFMNGEPKLPRLTALQADLFLDDSAHHTATARGSVPTGEVLWGPGHDGQRVFEAHPALTESALETERATENLPYVIIPAHPNADTSHHSSADQTQH
jgi:hypothetical protein